MYGASNIRHAVQITRDLRRVLALPRRVWAPLDAQQLAVDMTRVLCTPRGTQSLRPIQAVALYEAGTLGGAHIPARVGTGKTLISLLAPWVMQSRRPLLLVPANLVGKTRRAQTSYMRHWLVPNFLRIVSYEILGRIQSAELLARYQPDLIVADESHRLKNRRAAVTRRVLRYLDEHPGCLFVGMSGSPTKRSLTDYGHLVRRALGPARAPVPAHQGELEEWADALDEKPRAPARTDPGALALLCTPQESAEGLDGVRRGFRRRLVETPGVVATTEPFEGPSITLAHLHVDPGPAARDALHKLNTLWELPDGTPLADGLARWRHVREVALGFYYRWDPAPPRPWLEARRVWAQWSRHILTSNRRDLDSELQVTKAVADGLYPEALTALHTWQDTRDSFTPNTVPVWLDEEAVEAVVRWADQGPGIVWTEHTAFALRLETRTGLAYYGPKGLDRFGRRIPEEGDPGTGEGVIIASVASNVQGRNLQAWSRNLVTSPPPSGYSWEQLMGRTHRPGQAADEVTFDVLVACPEHLEALDRASADARYIEASTGQAQKLLYADRVDA